MRKNKFFVFSSFLLCYCIGICQQIDYSVISVPEERGLDISCVTQSSDYVMMPKVKRNGKGVDWLTNRVINISPDGESLAFLSARDNKFNIFIKEIGKVRGAVQRTNRSRILDFNYSPDGKTIAFSENRGNGYQIFTTDAKTGFICRQVTNGGNDYSPVFSNDLNTIYFARSEEQGASIWSCSLNNGMLSSYAFGFNPTLLNKPVETIICTRINGNGKGEIWMLDSKDGTEQCILSDLDHSFTSPSISPDGRWIVCTGSSAIPLDEKGKKFYHNTDIYLFKIDGSSLRQVTFHAAEDLSPVWSPTGDYIYFISQRGDSEGRANIWRIKFNEQDFN